MNVADPRAFQPLAHEPSFPPLAEMTPGEGPLLSGIIRYLFIKVLPVVSLGASEFASDVFWEVLDR